MDRIRKAILRRLRKAYRFIDTRIAPFCARTERRSSFYYGVWNPTFGREHRAMLLGKLKFDKLSTSPQESSSLLRRNTHRIEKGLLSKPRRDVFALQYIEETVECYAASLKETDPARRVASTEMNWAHDVLNEYFNVTGSHPLIDRLRLFYLGLPAPSEAAAPGRAEQRIPYKRDLTQLPAVQYEDLLKLARHRRSVRWFLQKPVPREVIEKAVRVAAESPSACNRQPFSFLVFDDPEMVQEVADLPGGTAGFNHNFPCIVVVLGRLSNYFDERDRHLIYIDGSLASMSFVLAIESQGLSTCCINWPDIPEREERARKVLNLTAEERPVMFIAVGYPDPDGLVAYSEKKPMRQLCVFNFDQDEPSNSSEGKISKLVEAP